MNTNEVFHAYERRFAKVMSEIPVRKPWLEKDREKIISATKKCLGIKDEWIPEIKAETLRTVKGEGFSIDFIKFESWKSTVGTAHIYKPEIPAGEKAPLVILCCGHGANGKLCPGYQAMARRLAKQGAMVIVPDNIGQGERVPMGHSGPVIPFACGMSVQGLIVMETLAWLEWAKKNPLVDKSRLAAIGNSGGGTLTMFLAALGKGLSAISSSGYPNTFEFIARKEKKHCHCNILPGIVGRLEMWELYGVFAPNKLMLFQGLEDSLFPADIFYSTARKVKSVYEEMNAAGAFCFEVMPGKHPWNNDKRFLISSFLAEALKLRPSENLEKDDKCLMGEEEKCLEKWPENALSADDIARNLSGLNPPDSLKLSDVYPPNPMPEEISQVSSRGDTMQILAQFECFLSDGKKII
ncbi:MAG: hypothetical protein A2017_13505 [Lentisphaerae bacterium GWF2_44_16]|nr:MAG: hypothetical protein A2017_13505 [Lentisphaerae bacterium GWF2_44_16]